MSDRADKIRNIYQIQQAMAEFFRQTGYFPTDAQLSEKTGLSTKTIQRHRKNGDLFDVPLQDSAALIGDALKKMREILQTCDENPSAQIQAARLIIQAATLPVRQAQEIKRTEKISEEIRILKEGGQIPLFPEIVIGVVKPDEIADDQNSGDGI